MTSNTNLASAINESIAERYILVHVRLRKWSPNTSDRKAADDLAESKGATRNSGRYIKNILAGADAELKAVEEALNDIRHSYYQKTVPFSMSENESRRTGARLLPAEKVFDFSKLMGDKQKVFREKLDAFKRVYPERMEQAIRNLGELADPTLYPHPDDIEKEFGVDTHFSPVPSSTDFTRLRGLDSTIIDRLGERLANQQSKMVTAALDDVRGRLKEIVTRAMSSLGEDADGKRKRFHASLFEQSKELVEMVSSFNLTDDPEIEEIRAKLEQSLAAHDADTVRNNDSLRRGLQTQATEMAERMKALGW